MELLQRILDEKNIKIALDNIRTKKNTCGTDGIMLSDLPEYWNHNKDAIYRDITNGAYTPGIVRQEEILTKSGKKRGIAILCSIDRLLIRAIQQVLDEKFEKTLSKSCFSYRKGLGTVDAVQKAAEYIKHGNVWVAEIDIENFFDNINIDILEKILEDLIEDKLVLSLIVSYLRVKIEFDGDISTQSRGILQGSSLSPLLSNLYLNEIDHILEKEGVCFCRFGDNINIYAVTYEKASDLRNIVIEYLSQIELFVNKEKGGVYTAKNRPYLGYEFFEKNNKIYIQKIVYKRRTSYNKWKKSSLEIRDNHFHIVSDGILTRKDFTILFENKEGKKYLPAEIIDSLNIYSNVSFSGAFFEYANRERISVSLINTAGK